MALLQQEEINYKNNTLIQKHLMNSTLVNKDPSSEMIPVASIVPLYSGALKKTNSDVIASELVEIVDEIKKKITNFVNAGDLLEYLGSHWIKLKCLAMRETQRSLSVLDFFMIPKTNKKIDRSLLVDFEELIINIHKKSTVNIVEHEDLTMSTWYGNKGKDAFLEELKNVNVDSLTPLQLHQFHKGEAFDLLMIVYDKVAKKPILFFIDYQSKDELLKEKEMDDVIKGKKTKRLRLPKNGKQYNHMKDDVLPYLKKKIEPKDSVGESSVLQSFANGDYYYVYLSTHYEEDIESFNKDKAIVLTRGDTKRFFSFLFPLYITLTGFVNDA
jgi:hypothetical protein